MTSDNEPDLSGTITHLLHRMRDGDEGASEELFRLVYAELQGIARQLVGRATRPGLESTELVNAACERLLGKARLDAQNRRHFFFLFGRAMRDVLSDEKRHHVALKRGGAHRRVPLPEVTDPRATEAQHEEIHAAIEALREVDPDAAQVVELKYLGQRTVAQTAARLACSVATVRRNLDYARAWLNEHLSSDI